ncbi:hypothetical protein F4693_000659 [Sphingomonas endophytica]|uniref:site-specific DNA-methyltransferase (adenine-specific) n=1 Tax=Sphingomonas endophytica TaxID=869719 RepID=A0A7X0MLX8_9SPHN|nr:N-6 DNA methylase [Sphingomonas endophytica]MBB6503704.1 hypothetical protein [Sphingomonas endophytica]
MPTRPELFSVQAEIGPRLAKLLDYLGYVGNAAYVDGQTPSPPYEIEHALRIGVTGAFCIGGGLAGGGARLIPIVYVAAAANEDEANAIHRDVWSQNVVPLLVLAMRDGVQIRNGFDVRRGGRTVPWEVVEQRKDNQDLAAVSAHSLISSVGWRDFSRRAGPRVDEHLLAAVSSLSRTIREQFEQLRERHELVNSVIGRMLYLLVLIDRKVITQRWVDGLYENGTVLCPQIVLDEDPTTRALWPATQTWALLDSIDRELNGSIFRISQEDRLLLPVEVLELVRQVLRYDRIDEGQVQFGFEAVRYRSIRTETISAIYELFLTLDDPELKVAHGAFYTPPYLADYVLDEMEGVRPFDCNSIVCDPACGSGIFLVGAYRRIVERSGAKGDREALRRLLVECVYGVERHEQAADVARFSLYLTMLDYLPDLALQAFEHDGEPLFPALDSNILQDDFFEVRLPDRLALGATHVVANPPWTKVSAGTAAEAFMADDGVPAVSDKRLSELFVWAIKRKLIATGGVMAILLSAKSFIAPVATRTGGKGFPHEVASRLRLRGLINLSHLRYKLFRGARNPALVLIAINDEPDDQHVWIASPLLSSQPVGIDGRPWAIAIDRGDVIHARPRELDSGARAWFWNLMLQPMDRRYIQLLAERTRPGASRGTTLGEFLKNAGMRMRNGDSPVRTGVPADMLLGTDRGKSNHYLTRLGLEGGGGDAYALTTKIITRLKPEYRHIFGGDALIVTRNLNRFDVIQQPIAFNSSLNAIVFTDKSTVPSGQRVVVLTAIKSFLSSHLARYLFALVGRSWLLDKRRVETTDLADLPFPYATIDDLIDVTVEGGDEEALLKLFIERFGMDDLFGAAVHEYATFRFGYEDGQLPLDASRQPTELQKSAYQDVLNDRLRAKLGRSKALPMHRSGSGGKITLRIELGQSRHVNPVHPRIEKRAAEYAWATALEFDPDQGLVTLTKPLSRAAWTLERAYSDAERVTAEILAA